MGLRENILTDTVGDLAMRPLITFTTDQTIRQVCDALTAQSLGAAVCVDEAGQPVGMFNEKLLIRVLSQNLDAMDAPVGEHMTTNVVCVLATDTIDTLIATMQERKLRWVCVVDESGKAIALTGLRGVMEYVVDHFPRCVFSQPVRANKLSMEHREGA